MKNTIVGLLVSLLLLSGNLTAKVPVTQSQKLRLTDNWEFLRQDVGSVWELVRPMKAGQPEESPIWTKVTLPHCFNAEDAVDPDVNYYQGPGWYKTQLTIDNPYKNGRILLEFEGAGQKTEVYIYTTKVGSHTGGYDSWNVDITDAVNTFLASKEAERFEGRVPLSIRCLWRYLPLSQSGLSSGGFYSFAEDRAGFRSETEAGNTENKFFLL